MNSLRIQPSSTVCANGILCSKGIFGSTRMDMTEAAIFDLLDANDSLATKMCDDPNMLFGDSSLDEDTNPDSVITCQEFMYTPFRDVGVIAKVWKRVRGKKAGGRSPMALALGFDDSNRSSDAAPKVKEDALNTYLIELKTDIGISCRSEFIILITDGGDNCSGDPTLSGSAGADTGCVSPCLPNPSVTGNANRRSSIQASSNARTFYARNPVANGNFPGQEFPKEILIFVIGIGVNDPEDVRALNGVALTGGTHTKGIIKHIDASGNFVGNVDIDDIITNDFFSGLPAVFKNIAKATDIATDPSGAQLEGCRMSDPNVPDENNGVCSYQGTDVFNNTYFNTSVHLTIGSTTVGESFAFFVSTPEEFVAALQSISGFLQAFS